MTFYQMQEIVRSAFPEYPLTLIKLDLNSGYKDFCSKTGLPRKSYNVAVTSATSYTLNSDVDKVYQVEVLNSDSQMIDDISWDIDNGIIYLYDTYGAQLVSMEDDVYSITIYYHAIPTALSADANTPLLASQFHYALIEYVFGKYYRRKSDVNNAKFAMQTYEQLVREGKQLCNTNGSTVHSLSTDYIFDINWRDAIPVGSTTATARSNTRMPSGATADRPTLTVDDVGYVYFDTDMDSPIWWSGTEWV